MATSYLVRDRKTFMSIAELSHLVKYFPLMAGGDVQVGQAIGETDDIVSAPVGEGFTPDDLAASFFRNIGIDPQTKVSNQCGTSCDARARWEANATVVPSLLRALPILTS